MTTVGSDGEWLTQHPARRGRMGTAWLAAVISAGLHVLAALEMPPIRITPAAWLASEPELPLRVETVRPWDEAPPIERPEAHLAELAERSFVQPVPPAEANVADPSRIESGVRSSMPEPAPVGLPDLPPARAEWQPRQQRLEISETLVPETAAVRPRRVVPAVERVAAAPDIVEPTPLPSAEPVAVGRPSAAGTGRGAEPGPMPAASPTDAPPVAPPPPPPRTPAQTAIEPGMAPTAAPAGEVARASRESGPDVTGMSPIEHLLRLEVTAWTPPDEPAWRYVNIEICRAAEEVLPVLPRDLFLVQDCSASMTAAKVAACRQGLHGALRTVADVDRFDLMSFRETVTRCFGEWMPANATVRARAGWFIEQMESRGMTDVYGALDTLRSLPSEPGRPVIAVIVTDGRPTVGLQDNFEIIQRFTDDNDGRVSVFAVGAGGGVNRFLLDFLSYKNRGASRIVEDLSVLPDALVRWVASLARPVLTDLSYRLSGLGEEEVFPRRLTHLYLDRSLVLHGRVPASAPPAGIRILGRSGTKSYDMVFSLDFDSAAPGDHRLRDEWVRQKLSWLVGEHIRTRNPAFRDEAIRLARRLGPSMPYAAELGLPDAPVRAD